MGRSSFHQANALVALFLANGGSIHCPKAPRNMNIITNVVNIIIRVTAGTLRLKHDQTLRIAYKLDANINAHMTALQSHLQ